MLLHARSCPLIVILHDPPTAQVLIQLDKQLLTTDNHGSSSSTSLQPEPQPTSTSLHGRPPTHRVFCLRVTQVQEASSNNGGDSNGGAKLGSGLPPAGEAPLVVVDDGKGRGRDSAVPPAGRGPKGLNGSSLSSHPSPINEVGSPALPNGSVPRSGISTSGRSIEDRGAPPGIVVRDWRSDWGLTSPAAADDKEPPRRWGQLLRNRPEMISSSEDDDAYDDEGGMVSPRLRNPFPSDDDDPFGAPVSAGSDAGASGDASPSPGGTALFSSNSAIPSPGMDRLPAQPLRLRVLGAHAGQTTRTPDRLPLVGPWVLSTSHDAFPGTDCLANLQV